MRLLIFSEFVLFRTLSETAVAAGLLAWLILFGVPAIRLDEVIFCEAHGYLYECAGHPQVRMKQIKISGFALFSISLIRT